MKTKSVAALMLAVVGIGCLTVSSASGVRDRGASRAAEQARTPLGTVTIHLWGYVKGREFTGRGRFTISGAIADRGTFLRQRHGLGGPLMYTGRLLGARGTITITGQEWGPWRIFGRTGAYAGLRGHSTRPVLGDFSGAGLRMIMIGTVSGWTTG